jgi:hypothetical protein
MVDAGYLMALLTVMIIDAYLSFCYLCNSSIVSRDLLCKYICTKVQIDMRYTNAVAISMFLATFKV